VTGIVGLGGIRSTKTVDSNLSEFLRFDGRGHLMVEELDVDDLARAYGTPLYVTSERQIRQNYRRFAAAFAGRYPRVTILFANKANSNLAVRRVLTQEGAGGDCFGRGELTVSLESGVPPEKLVLNGSNKSTEDLTAAIEVGATIHVDHPGELEEVDRLAAQLGREARIGLRALPFSYADLGALSDEMAAIARDQSHDKWGLDRPTLRELVPLALGLRHVRLRALHCHVSRLRPTTEHFQLAAQLMVACVTELRDRCGWQPDVLDIGGGYAHERDPESGRPAGGHRVATPEEYAETIATSLREGLAANGLAEPHLFLEPGRRLVSNATVLLGRVGVVKRLPTGSATWVNLDASTNHCLRTLIAGYRYEIVSATRGLEPADERVNVTGPNCTIDLLGGDRALPRPRTGDLLAVLDVGGYAEMTANQFNLLPRPATVLVNGSQADVIRRRETLSDLLVTQQVPARLCAPATEPDGAASDAFTVGESPSNAGRIR
jgi:diaminopimelate decarboxylase